MSRSIHTFSQHLRSCTKSSQCKPPASKLGTIVGIILSRNTEKLCAENCSVEHRTQIPCTVRNFANYHLDLANARIVGFIFINTCQTTGTIKYTIKQEQYGIYS